MGKSPNETRAMSVRPAECKAGTTPSDARVVALRMAVGAAPRRAGAADQGGYRSGRLLAGGALAGDQLPVHLDPVLSQGVAVAAQPGG